MHNFPEIIPFRLADSQSASVSKLWRAVCATRLLKCRLKLKILSRWQAKIFALNTILNLASVANNLPNSSITFQTIYTNDSSFCKEGRGKGVGGTFTRWTSCLLSWFWDRYSLFTIHGCLRTWTAVRRWWGSTWSILDTISWVEKEENSTREKVINSGASFTKIFLLAVSLLACPMEGVMHFRQALYSVSVRSYLQYFQV